jgi:flagellar biosynthesis/type III secretory pathway M-ring protein FliF/YscJ
VRRTTRDPSAAGPTVGQILGVIVVVMFLRGLFKRTGGGEAAVATAGGPAAKDEVDEKNLTPEELQKRMRREIERSITNDPAALAKLLEAWLTEQKA